MYFARPEFTTPVFVATVAGGTDGRVYPLAPVYRSQQLKYLRVNLLLEALSPGDNKLTVEVGLQVSDDGVTWDTSTTAPGLLLTDASRSSEGKTNVTAFQDVSSSLTKPFARLVLWVKNYTGETGYASCLASIRVERKTC